MMSFCHPLLGHRVSQSWGENATYWRDWGYAGHPGWDFAAPVGTPVRASHGGILSNRNDPHGLGLYVAIRSPGVGRTHYAHLERFVLPDGVAVWPGEIVGYVGLTGNTTGPHLHWEWLPEDGGAAGYKGRQDPWPLVEVKTMVNKYTLHVQGTEYDDWLIDAAKRLKVNVVKLLDLDHGDWRKWDFVEWIVARLVFDSDADKALISQGAAGAEAYVYNWFLPRARRLGDFGKKRVIWEGLNEPDVGDLDKVRRYADFERRRIRRMRELGYLTTSGQFSTGNPPGTQRQIEQAWEIMGAAWKDERPALVNVHEYGMRKMTIDGVHLGRYQIGARVLAQMGLGDLQFCITETGIDYSGDPVHDGWRKHTRGVADFMAQLDGYGRYIGGDPRVAFATPFTWKPYNWPSFEINQSDTGHFVIMCEGLGPWAPLRLSGGDGGVNIEEQVREKAWALVGLHGHYNPDAALAKKARAAKLGKPEAPEQYDIPGYVYQPYSGGIVYTRSGEWGLDQIKVISY